MRFKEWFKRKWKDLLICLAIPCLGLLVFSFPSITNQGSTGTYYPETQVSEGKIEKIYLNGAGFGNVVCRSETYTCTWFISISGGELSEGAVVNIKWNNHQSQFDYISEGIIRDQSSQVIYSKK